MSLSFLISKYRILGKKGEGTFSEVLKCQNIKDGSYWACKKMKQHYKSFEQVHNLREIQAMRRLNPHPNVVELNEVLFDKSSGCLALICELMDMNIYELIRGRRHYLAEKRVKNYMYQLLKSVDHMHRHGIFHRDVKPENILIREDVLKLADFGSCRSIHSKQPYTEYISTRWYRAPECLLTDGYYTYKMDIWSVGCVFFEITSLHPLFPGANEVDQIAKIHDVMGTPKPDVLSKLQQKTRGINFNFPEKSGTGIEKLLPHSSSDLIDLIYQMCEYDPEDRITAKQALRHPYFKEFREAERAERAERSERAERTEQNMTGNESDRSHGGNNLENRPKIQRHRHRDLSIIQRKRTDTPVDHVISPVKDDEEETTNKLAQESSKKHVAEPFIEKNILAVGSGFTSKERMTKFFRKNDPITDYYRRDRKYRKPKRMADTGGNSLFRGSYLTKLPPTKPSTFQPLLQTQSKATLPKLRGEETSTSSVNSSLKQAFLKSDTSKNTGGKNPYGNFRLPSIDTRRKGY